MGGFKVFTRMDLRDGRHWEDGSIRYREVNYVVAEAPDGRRWRSRAEFSAQTDAEAFAARLRRCKAWVGPERNPGAFEEMDPAYGSPAYEVAEPELVARERAEG